MLNEAFKSMHYTPYLIELDHRKHVGNFSEFQNLSRSTRTLGQLVKHLNC